MTSPAPVSEVSAAADASALGYAGRHRNGRLRGPLWNRLAVFRRLGVVGLDEAVSGGSNVLATVVAARLLTPGAFGRFGIVLIVYGLVIGVLRSAVCTPVLMQAVRTREQIVAVMSATWMFTLASVPLLGLSSAGAMLADPELGRALLVLTICTPFLIIQDLARFLAFGFLRPGYALLSDTVWLVAFILGASVLVVSGNGGLMGTLIVWAGTGAGTGLLALLLWPPLRSGRPAVSWFAANWHLSWRFTVAFASAQLSALGLTLIVRSMLNAATVGAVVGAQLLTRPYTTVEMALVGAGVAEIANSAPADRHYLKHAARTSAAALVVAGVNAAIMLLLPDAIGARLLGDTWGPAQPYLLPLAVQLLAMAFAVGPRVGLIGAERVDLMLRISLGFIPCLLVAALGGAYFSGGVAAVWGITITWIAVGLVWWWIALTTTRTPSAATPVPVSAPALVPAPARAPAAVPRPRPRPSPAPRPRPRPYSLEDSA